MATPPVVPASRSQSWLFPAGSVSFRLVRVPVDRGKRVVQGLWLGEKKSERLGGGGVVGKRSRLKKGNSEPDSEAES
jgi:hypothetical protein